jgi:ABC-type transporter Mla subunit MlaD
MIISNPKSVTDLVNIGDDSNLISLKQLKNALTLLDQKVIRYLNPDVGGVCFENTLSGNIASIPNKNGFAYLDENKKVDASLIPSIAITNMYEIDQTIFKEFASPYVNDYNFQYILRKFIESSNFNYPSLPEYGDLIIISFNENNNTIDSIDVSLIGTYFVDFKNDDFYFKKLPQISSVTSVNEILPDKLNGSIIIDFASVLKFIDKSKYNFKFDDNETLENNLIRITSNDKFKLGFIIDNNTVEYYITENDFFKAKTELETLINSISDASNSKSSFLSGIIDSNYEEIHGLINDISGNLNTKIENNYDSLNTLISDTAVDLDTKIENNYSETNNSIENTNNLIYSVSSELNTTSSLISSKINGNDDKINNLLSTTSSNLNELIENNYNKLNDSIENLSSEVNATSSFISSVIDENFIKLNDTLITVSGDLRSTIENNYDKLSSSIDNTNNFINSVQGDTEDIFEIIGNDNDEPLISGTLYNQINWSKKQINDHSLEFINSNNLISSLNDIQIKTINDLQNLKDETISGFSDIKSNLELSSQILKNDVNIIKNVQSKISGDLIDFEENTSQNFKNTQESLENLIGQLSSTIDNMKNTISNIDKSLSSAIESFDNSILNVNNNLLNSINTLTSHVTSGIMNVFCDEFTWNNTEKFEYKINKPEPIRFPDADNTNINWQKTKINARFKYSLSNQSLYDLNVSPIFLGLIDENNHQIICDTIWNNNTKTIDIIIEYDIISSVNSPDNIIDINDSSINTLIGKTMKVLIAAKPII